MFNFRTDLALERRDLYKNINKLETEIDGIETESKTITDEISVSKVKIINENSEDFGRIYKVRRMNYNEIIVNYPLGNGLKYFSFEDVECIRENTIDDFLINNRDFLKIKLKRGIWDKEILVNVNMERNFKKWEQKMFLYQWLVMELFSYQKVEKQ